MHIEQRADTFARCRLCGGGDVVVGSKVSAFGGRRFTVRQCQECWFGWVDDARSDYDVLYDADYYRGLGADPLVDYAGEMVESSPFRRHEWRGILRIAESLQTLDRETRWLDIGSGVGGLVRFLRASGIPAAVGSEDGYARTYQQQAGIPCLSSAELAGQKDEYDLISCIEVIEHVPDPIAFLEQMYCLLKPGGVFFLTTGNARRYRGRLDEWSYVIPDIHVSFFEPSTVERALVRAGFSVEYPGFVPGFDDVIRYKTLKHLPKPLARVADHLPGWSVAARLADRRFGVTSFPVGRKPATA